MTGSLCRGPRRLPGPADHDWQRPADYSAGLVARLRGFGAAGAASTAFGASVVSMSAFTTSAVVTTPAPTTFSPRATSAVYAATVRSWASWASELATLAALPRRAS